MQKELIVETCPFCHALTDYCSVIVQSNEIHKINFTFVTGVLKNSSKAVTKYLCFFWFLTKASVNQKRKTAPRNKG